MRYPITPCPKPRMTRKDKWAKRPAVVNYWAFAEECRLRIHQPLDGTHITFFIPMPRSWSKKKKVAMAGKPHQQRPDLDNFCKALFDSLYEDDSGISRVLLEKVWAEEGAIQIEAIK